MSLQHYVHTRADTNHLLSLPLTQAPVTGLTPVLCASFQQI